MKKILVPTDFSENAANALNFAIAFANAFGSQITLIHTFKMYSSAGMFISVESYMEDDARKDLAEIVKNTRPKLTNGATMIQKLFRGDSAPLIGAIADKQDFDLIIMGTQGASGLKEIFTGSTTNGVIKASKTPLLMIPAGFKFAKPTSIVFAIDQNTIGDLSILDPLLQIVEVFKLKLDVFHQADTSTAEEINDDVKAVLDPLEASYHLRVNQQSISEGIDNFVKETQADILCMIRRKRGFLEQIFHQSVTTLKAFHSDVPVLVLHDGDD